MDSWLVFRSYRVILNQWTKRNGWSVKGHSEPPFAKCFRIRKFILNVSQIAVTCHGIRPPFFIQTWLQQYRRCPFFNSAHCSLSNPIRFRSVRCWRTMIPGEIFTSFSEFQGIVSVKWILGFLVGSENFCKLFSVPWEFFVLHGLFVSTVLPSLVPLQTYRWSCLETAHPSPRTLWSAVIKSAKFCAQGTTVLVRLLHGSPRNFGSQADIAISVLLRSE